MKWFVGADVKQDAKYYTRLQVTPATRLYKRHSESLEEVEKKNIENGIEISEREIGQKKVEIIWYRQM